MRKVLLTGLFLFFAVYGVTKADAVDDAAKLVYDGEVTTTEISKIFSASEMKKVNEKVKELKLEELKEKKGREEEKKENKLLTLIKGKKTKENILVEDIDKELTRVETRVTKLENRVNKLEGNTTSKVVKKVDAKMSTKKTKIDEIAQKIIKGELGDGTERVEKLKKLGYSSKEITAIQKLVNEIIQ